MTLTKNLRVFLDDGESPIDNSASERSIRTFCVGKKNWVFIDSVKGAEASAVIYSISKTAKLNGLSTYNYFNHLLTELLKLIDRERNVSNAKALESLLTWAKELPDICRKPRRKKAASLCSVAYVLTLTMEKVLVYT